MWYNSGMGITDWLMLAAVIVALGLGVTSILHTQSLQKRERREKLLNEIIEWATDVASCGIEPTSPEVEEVTDAEALTFLSNQVKKLGTLQLLRARSEKIKEISLNIGSAMTNTVDEVTRNLKNQLSSLYGFKHDPGPLIIREVVQNNALLYSSAVKLIQEATRFKTKDIS
ncbi:hypothetical protein ES707_22474 [subsurface metagenome]